MTDLHPVRRALLSVSDKTGLIELATALAARGVDSATAACTAVARHLVAGRSLAAIRGWFPAEAIADEVARRYGT